MIGKLGKLSRMTWKYSRATFCFLGLGGVSRLPNIPIVNNEEDEQEHG
jgi:hypothetical protein